MLSGSRVRCAGLLFFVLILLKWLAIGGAQAETLPEVIAAGEDRAIRRWDSMGKLTTTIGTHDDTVLAIALAPGSSGKTLISLSAEGALKVWDVPAKRLVFTTLAHPGGASALALTTDGQLIATGGADGRIRFWSLSGQRRGEAETPGETVRVLRFTSDGGLLVSGDRLIRTWRVRMDGASVGLDYLANIIAHDAGIAGLALSPDDRTIASVSRDEFLKTWRREGGDLVHRVRVGGRGALAVAYSPDGQTIATGDEEGRVRLWNAATGMALPFHGSHERAVYALAWTSDGKMLVSGGADRTLRYWKVSEGREAAKVTTDGPIRALAIVP